jgi:hypothetical protein
MILGDLGADVIKVEPPGGTASRQCGPFIEGADGAERSLAFHAYNRNKRSIVLDLVTQEDRTVVDIEQRVQTWRRPHGTPREIVKVPLNCGAPGMGAH